MEQESLTTLVVSAGLILGLTALGVALIQVLAARAGRVIQAMKHIREARRQQMVTFVHLMQWGAHVILVVSALLMLLSEFGIDITPLLASAGVAGLAVSLGAQTLIKDFIAGALILGENQYAVGDTIQVGQVTGEVERISLRSTHVRDVNGYLFVVPNGEVRVVANLNRDWSRAIVDIGLAYETDLERALRILEESVQAFAEDPDVAPQLLEPPKLLAPLSLTDSAVNVRVMVKTQTKKQYGVARQLRKWLLATCEREGIELPYPRQEVLLRTLGQKPPPAKAGKETA